MTFGKTLLVSITLLLLCLSSVFPVHAFKIAMDTDVINKPVNHILPVAYMMKEDHEKVSKVLKSTADAESDRQALVALYNNTDGSNWRNPWDLNELTGTWEGVEVDENGRVIQLKLTGRGVNGTLPAEIGELTALKVLSVNNEVNLRGSIPPEIGNLINLEELYLSFNSLGGEIPVSLVECKSLTMISISEPQLSGTLPEALGNLENLKSLSVSSTRISGNIPASIGDLTQLESLSLVGNELSGTIPPGIGGLVNLNLLRLDGNQLSGEIPPEIGELTSVEAMRLSANQLEGDIPSTLGDLVNLSSLSLSDNLLSGNIPGTLGKLTNLTILQLDGNRLTGNIPAELGNVPTLVTLHLQNNQLTGEIPEALGNLKKLQILYLNNNQLGGEIPESLSDFTKLVDMNLSGNQFNGNFPPSFANNTFANLSILDIQDNQLTFLPDLTHITSLTNFTVSNNNLSFDDILPNLSHLTEYIPQDSIGEVLEVKLNPGDDYSIELDIDEAIEDNSYQWFKDGAEHEITSENALVFENLITENAGVYTAEVTNPGVTDLTLFSRPVTIIFNALPVVTSTPVVEATVGTGYVYAITATDPEGDALTITATTLPAWLELTDHGDGTATLQGTPQVSDCADNQVMLVAIEKDENGSTSEQNFEINISLDLSVSVAADKTAVCAGETVTFTATLSETVENPVFTWLVNEEAVEGEVGSSFTTSSLNDGDMVEVKVNAESASCVVPGEILSNQVSVSVGESFTMSVAIQADRTTICQGEEVTFTAEVTNAGSDPQFSWNVNDNPVGVVGSETFTTDLLDDGDVVSVVVTTEAEPCIANTTARAEVSMHVTDQLILAVTVTSDKAEITAGENVTFTASTDYTTSAVEYAWFINKQVVNGETTATFTTNTLQNNDKVKVQIVAEPVDCLAQAEATSEEITITVNDTIVPEVEDIAKTMNEDTELAFKTSDFSSAFTGNLSTLRVTALPASGTLILNGATVSVNQEVAVSQVSGLKYIPDADVNGEDAFGWNGSNGNLFAENDAAVHITIRSINDPPEFTLSGNVIVSKNFTTVEQVIVTPEEVPNDELSQFVTYQLIPPTVSFANLIFDPQSGRVAITSLLDQTGKQEFEIVANDGQVENNTHIESFILEVKSANVSPPKDIAADNLFIAENQPRGTLIGTITVTDDDTNDRHVLSLDDNNTLFFIDGNQLKTNAVLDFEEKATYEVSVRATDLGGNFLVEPFTITVTDENDLPTDLRISAHEIVENEPIGTQIGRLTALDQDEGDILRYMLVADAADNALFSLSDNVLVSDVVFDFEENEEYEIVVRVEDESGGAIEEAITILVIDLEPEEIEIISGFTPDNDRMNDTWEIAGLVSYPRCTVAVYNSWGQQVFFSRGYSKPWDGSYKNKDVPVGTYYYIIDLDNGQPPITGNIAVMR